MDRQHNILQHSYAQYAYYISMFFFINLMGMAPDKKGYRLNIFLILHENICCGYSLEVHEKHNMRFHAKIRKIVSFCFVLFDLMGMSLDKIGYQVNIILIST